MSTWHHTLAGRFIVFDGPDGSGKTTQFRRFAAACREAGLTVCEVREPGGTVIGERIRDVLLDRAHTEMDVRCETMLYMASRAQLVNEVVGPALARGELVLADRFISSTLAYQGTGGGLTMEEILAVGRVAVGDHMPHLVVIFDVDEEEAARRLGGRASSATEPSLFADRMEQKEVDFRRRVRQGYLDQAADSSLGVYIVIDGAGPEDTVYERLVATVQERMASR